MDHDRVNIHHSGMSCGVLELSRISSDTDDVLYAIASRLYHPSRGDPAAIIVWSDIATEETSSGKLADSVKAQKFGRVIGAAHAENPKTGNIIVLYLWTIDHAAFKAWYAQKRVEKLKKVGT